MSSNKLLSRLSRADALLLEPHLRAVELPLRTQLQARNKHVRHVYFPDSGVASTVANGERPMEVSLVGWEGMTGVSLVLGNTNRVPNETYMQIAGRGQRLSASSLLHALAASVTLQQVLLRYVDTLLTQTTQTALANGRSKIDERLARWLLMAHDRIDGNDVVLTHELLSVMLGVQRSGVTRALQDLEGQGLIARRRSRITVVDREGLVDASNGSYSRAKEA